MNKTVLLSCLILLCFGLPVRAKEVSPYMRVNVVTGLYKMHGNEATDGHMPSTTMSGLSVAGGAAIPLSNNGVYLRAETAYTFGYKHSPSTNYSAFTIRTGFEFSPEGARVIPYFLVGGGVLALDPPRAVVQTGPMFDLSGGIRFPLDKKGYSVDLGWMFSRGFLKYSEKTGESRADRVVGVLGLHRAF